MATLIACAPWEPPKIRTLGGPATRSGATSKNSGRTGLPVTNPFPPKKRTVDSNVTAALLTTRASRRFVSPGTAFCSSSSVGIRRAAAASTTGPELYPPTPMTTSGERRERMRQASRPLSGRSDKPSHPRLERRRFDAGAPQHIERETLARNDTRLDPPRRPGERHDCVRLPAQHFPRDGNPGKEMAAGSTAGDENAQRFHASDGGVDTATA